MANLNRTVARAVVVSLCALGLPIPGVQAELIATDRIEATQRDEFSGRELLRSLLNRTDVRTALERQVVSTDEAKARVNAMSDDEAAQLAARFDSFPAGGNGFESALWAGLLVFVILLVTDILGFTKIFSFTRPAK